MLCSISIVAYHASFAAGSTRIIDVPDWLRALSLLTCSLVNLPRFKRLRCRQSHCLKLWLGGYSAAIASLLFDCLIFSNISAAAIYLSSHIFSLGVRQSMPRALSSVTCSSVKKCCELCCSSLYAFLHLYSLLLRDVEVAVFFSVFPARSYAFVPGVFFLPFEAQFVELGFALLGQPYACTTGLFVDFRVPSEPFA